MLRQLRIRDFALVREIDVELDRGLTVLTGESGAGKSILVEALGHVLGDRAAATDVRPGASRSEVSAEFDVTDNEEVQRLLAERGLDDPDDACRCLLRRVMSAEGRSRAYVNGSAVTRHDLEAVSAALVDIHGQNEHQLLLRREVQLTLLDDFAGHAELRDTVAASFEAWQTSAAELARMAARIDQSRDRQSLLEYQVAELDALALEPGEFEALDARFKRLAKRQEIIDTVTQALAAFADEGSDLDTLRRAATLLARVPDDHPSLASSRDLIATALTHLDESAGELRRYLEALTAESEDPGDLERRLDAVITQARKHHVRPELLYEQHAALADELAALTVDASSVPTLEREVTARREEYRSAAEQLSGERRTAAQAFAKAVSRHLNRLGIRGGALQLEFTPAETRAGLDAVEYWIVTNPNYPAAPLARIASGGERSRVSLAIQVVAAERSRLKCLVLDEADVGIGGATADVLGRLLRKLAERTQVLCVTHAPQVAALGDHHVRVVKTLEQDTGLEKLDRAARVQELARMLSGADITHKTLEYAEELIASGAS